MYSHCKSVLENVKSSYAAQAVQSVDNSKKKQKTKNLDLAGSGKLQTLYSIVKLSVPSIINGPEVISSLSDKPKL